MSAATARVLQYVGSPFTPIDGNLPQVPDGNTRSTRFRYYRQKGQITCDANGSFTVIVPGDPYASPFPFYSSDINPTNLQPGFQWTTYGDDQCARAENAMTQIDAKFPGLGQTLHQNPPCHHRPVFSGFRVWSLAGMEGSQGIIRGSQLDSQILNSVLTCNDAVASDKLVMNGFGISKTIATLSDGNLGASVLVRSPNGIWSANNLGSSVANLPGLMPITYSPSPGPNSNYAAYLREVIEACQFPFDYHDFQGQDGCTLRSNPCRSFGKMRVFGPRSIVYPTSIYNLPPTDIVSYDSSATGSALLNTHVTYTGHVNDVIPYDSTNIPSNCLPYNADPKFPASAITGSPNIGSASMPVGIIFTQGSGGNALVPGYGSFRSNLHNGAFTVSTTSSNYFGQYLMQSSVAGTNWYVSLGDSVLTTPGGNAGTQRGWTNLHTYRTAILGDYDAALSEDESCLTSMGMVGDSFQAGQVLWCEIVFGIEESNDDTQDVMQLKPVYDSDFATAVMVLQDPNAFPVIVKGHSFFSNVRSALSRVGKFAGRFVEALGGARSLATIAASLL